MVSGHRATQQVGRRVGAHRRPRPGRATGSRRFPGPQPVRTRPGRRFQPLSVPANAYAIDGRSGRSTPPTRRPARSAATRPSSSPASPPAARRHRPRLAQPARCQRGISVRQAAALTLTGRATFYDNGTTAMRLPRGTVVVICGNGGCIERVVNDYGPQKQEPGRRPVPAGLLRDLRLPVVVRARPRSRSTSTDRG